MFFGVLRLARSTALNVMTSYSQGVALWIGVNMHEARIKYSQEQLDDMIGEFDISWTIQRMLECGAEVYYLFQYPGELPFFVV